MKPLLPTYNQSDASQGIGVQTCPVSKGENMAGSIEAMYDSLSDEQKERVKAASSPEDILRLAQDAGYELSEDQLEGIAGGASWGGCNPHCGTKSVCDDHYPSGS